ncbi:MAG: pseudouridine synthase [Burkholderiales bacterium]
MAQLILFNKPYGVLCQFSPAASGAPTLKDYLPQRGIYPAGRLDADSEGLVVLTDDGALQHRIADPRHKLPKTYYAEVEGTPTDVALQQLAKGIDLGEFKTLPAAARIVPTPTWLWPRVPPIRFRRHIPTAWLEITLREGKNRQVRRMTAAVGLPTLRLIRYRVGNWTLDGLDPGKWRQVSAEATVVFAAAPQRGRSTAGGQKR